MKESRSYQRKLHNAKAKENASVAGFGKRASSKAVEVFDERSPKTHPHSVSLMGFIRAHLKNEASPDDSDKIISSTFTALVLHRKPIVNPTYVGLDPSSHKGITLELV